MNKLNKKLIICAPYSYLNHQKISIPDATNNVLELTESGAAIVHMHVDKFISPANYIEVMRCVFSEKDVLFNVGLKDFITLTKFASICDVTQNLIVSTHTAQDVQIFNNRYSYTADEIRDNVKLIEDYGAMVDLMYFNTDCVTDQIIKCKAMKSRHYNFSGQIEHIDFNIDTPTTYLSYFAFYDGINEMQLSKLIRRYDGIRLGAEDGNWSAGNNPIDEVGYSKMEIERVAHCITALRYKTLLPIDIKNMIYTNNL
jgi:hypothetical protein